MAGAPGEARRPTSAAAGGGGRPDTDHLAFYGLRDFPFRDDGRPPWLGRARRAALAALSAAMATGNGLFLLTGDAGMGKTTLLAPLVDVLDAERWLVGRLPPSVFEVADLSGAVADAFAIEERFDGPAAFAVRFRQLLGDARLAGRAVLLVIDDAHNLGDALLGKVFDLLTIGAFEGHPLAILLVGQTELATALDKDEHAGLRQRIAARCVLEPLSPEAVGEYVRFRLGQVGAEGTIFDAGAIERVTSMSRGAPGVINVVCDGALVTGYRRQVRTIGREIVDASLGGPDGARDAGPAHGSVFRVPRAAGRPMADSEVRGTSRRAAGATRQPRRAGRPRTTVALALGGLLAVALGVVGYFHLAPRVSPVAQDRFEEVPPPGAAAVENRAATSAPAASGLAAEPDRPSEASAPPRSAVGQERALAPRAPAPPRRVEPATRSRATDARPLDVAPRERAAVRPEEREPESGDPAAIIDWLMKESGRR